jgi:hypothetical protein
MVLLAIMAKRKAELIFYERINYEDGSILEMKLWRVSSPVPSSAHEFKYSLFYGRPGVREIGYDNERGKGAHKHFRDIETSYRFETVEKLIADFLSDVKTLRGGT